MKINFGHPDYSLLIVFFVLLSLGVLILTSTSVSISQEEFGSPFRILFHQIEYGIFPGLILGIFCFFVPLSFLKKYSVIFLLVVLCFMVLIFVPGIGVSIGGATRWVKIGNFSFQPSEFLKLSFFIYLAAWISNRGNAKNFKRDNKKSRGFKTLFIPFLVIIGLISLLLILQPDISTLGMIVFIAVLMYFVVDTPLYQSILLILGGIVGLLALIAFAPYRWNRVMTFLSSEIDPMGISYQIGQSLIAIGSGGVWGKGLGMGIQKFGFLPQPFSDSIFSVFAEETGFIGSLVLIVLFMIFAILGLNISSNAKDKFSRTLAFSITCWIIVQAFVNISSITGILPLTGIPLPFIAYGGSHLIAELAGVGILLNISKH